MASRSQDAAGMRELTPVHVAGSPEEPWHVVLEDGEGRVEVLQDTDDGVVLLHGSLGSLQRAHGVEWPAERRRTNVD